MIEFATDGDDTGDKLPLDDEVPAGAEDTEGSDRADDAGETPVEAEILDEAPATTALVVTPDLEPESLMALATDDQIERAIKRTLARIAATKRYKVALLSMTNHRDWFAHKSEGDPDGIPYLAESGSEKVIHAFEIEIEHDGGRREVNPEGGYEYVYQGRMRALQFSDVWYPVIGSRWSEDGFFTRGGKQRPDPGDVRKSALTNFYNRGIKTVCGLRTLTWEELEAIPHLAGLRKKVTLISYGSGGGGGGGATTKPGEKSAIAKGPHILVKIGFGDEKNKALIKKLQPWNWNGTEGCKYWEVGYTEENFGRVMDMHAADEQAVKFKLVNVPYEDLPK
jgi:hypothetical protein